MWTPAIPWIPHSTSPYADGAYKGGDRLDGDWQIPLANRVGQKLPLSLVHPQSDLNTYAFALHRKASANHTYRTRVTVQGGEMPFKMELINAPAGASIVGEFTRTPDPIVPNVTLHTRPDDYGVVTWPNASGTGTFEVLITDQTGSTVTAEWTAETDETAFVYLDAIDGSDAADGSFATPLKTFPTGLWKNSDVDSTYADKIVCYKTGIYEIYSSAPGSFAGLDAGVKPRSHIGIEPNVIFDMSSGSFFGNTDNLAFYNITWDGVYTPSSNVRLLQISVKGSNYFFDSLTYRNQTTAGTTAGDNPACIVAMDDVVAGHNFSVINCVQETTSYFQLVTLFSSENILYEGNTAIDIDYDAHNGSQWLHAKDDCENISVRFNKGTSVGGTLMIAMSNQRGGLVAANQEVCYNYLSGTGYTSEEAPIRWNQSATGGNNAANTNHYRNTIESNINAVRCEKWVGGDDVDLSADAWVGSTYIFSQSSAGFNEIAPLSEQLQAADIDSNGGLTDTNGERTTWLGKRGQEVAA